MTDALPETPHFGLTRVGSGESVSKNGYSAQDLDRLTLDKLLYAAFNHRHDGIPPLGSPTYPPTLVSTTTVGNLPAATTYYYRVSYIDEYGLETAASPEAAVTTPAPVSAPEAAAVDVLLSGGTVTAGSYSYLITYLDDMGGETTPSAIATIQVTGSTSRVQITLPDIPTITDPLTQEQIIVATAYNIYRSRPGQSDFYFLATTTDAVYYDTGEAEDQTITAPTTNTTNATNGIEVTIPSPPDSTGYIPLGCVAWRIYRANSSGGYDGNSLVHEVTEGVTNTSTTPTTSYIDTGDALLQGFPKNTSSVPPSSPILDGLTVNVPRGKQVFSSFAAGTITNGELVNQTATPHDLSPVKLSATFKTPPSGGQTVTFRFTDGSGTHVDLVCSSATHQSGDASGYWHYDFPLVINGLYEAEDGVASRDGMQYVDDVTATSGQAVQLDSQDDTITIDLGALQVGNYSTKATLKVIQYDTSIPNDIVIDVYNASTSTVLGSSTVSLVDETVDTYQLISGPSFAANGTSDIQIRVRKATSSFQTTWVDNIRFTAEHTDLVAGTLAVTATVSGGSAAADANVAIWF